jgi:hypothetical protein
MRAAAAALAFLLSGCAETAREVRAHTYPPELRYYENREIRTAMARMARGVITLAVLKNERLTAEERAAVTRALREIDEAAAELSTPAARSNHPLLDRYLDEFRRDVDLARAAAGRDPPNYHPAGAVAGSCAYCHREAAR